MARKIVVPTELVLSQIGQDLRIQVPDSGVETILIDVGKDMEIGFEESIQWRSKAPLEEITRWCGKALWSGDDGVLTGGHGFYRLGFDGIPRDPWSFFFVVNMSFFETDIPPQHMWRPEQGKFKILWEREFLVPTLFSARRR